LAEWTGTNKGFSRSSSTHRRRSLAEHGDGVRVCSTKEERRTPRYAMRRDEMRVVKA
jgi:hypothetical protein